MLSLAICLICLKQYCVLKCNIIGYLLIAGVEIFWHEQDLLIISPIHKEDFGSGSRAQYEVSIVYYLFCSWPKHSSPSADYYY